MSDSFLRERIEKGKSVKADAVPATVKKGVNSLNVTEIYLGRRESTMILSQETCSFQRQTKPTGC